MENCTQPQTIYNKSLGSNITVQCGKCPLCRHSHRMNWLMRCQQESYHTEMPNQWFVTLTYDEKHVPRRKQIRTLYKRHPQLFFKRLRKAGFKIKYILVGEYGSQTERPHYHCLLWTNATYQSIDTAWTYGAVHYRPMEVETILYTLKYVLNPRQGDNTTKQSEYAVYSKGIGLGYLTEQMYQFHTGDYENPIYYTVVDGKKIPLPRYYRKKIFTKYQNYKHAVKTYYKALRDKMAMIRRLGRKGYKNPWKAYESLKHERARRVIKLANLKKQKV